VGCVSGLVPHHSLTYSRSRGANFGSESWKESILCCLKESKERMEASKSDVARLLRQIDLEYQAAKWGLIGLASGTSQHHVITQKMENMGKAFETLTHLVGSPEEAGKMVAQTLKDVPDTPTRGTLVDFLQRELDQTEESAMLIDHIQEIWETMDVLITRFGCEPARKIMETPSSLGAEKEGVSHE